MLGYGEEPDADEVVTVDVVIEAEDVVVEDTNGVAVVVSVADNAPADVPAVIEPTKLDTEAAVSPADPELMMASGTSFKTS